MTQVRTMKRASALFALVMALVLVLSALGASEADARKNRATASRVTTFATIDGLDDEIFTPDERCHIEDSTEVVLRNSVPRKLMYLECKWGGEVRVELNLNGRRFNNGSVLVTGVARLYEGTSEDTQDLDGEKDFSISVPKGQTVNIKQRVENTDEGGDFADIDMSFHNAPVKRR
jgi:hypothetical protein